MFPFHLFLFSFAVLGPLHYFTEIPWLRGKSYFTFGRYDFLVLIGLACLIGVAHYLALRPGADVKWLTLMVGNLFYVAFFGALAMTMLKSWRYKMLALVLAVGSAVLLSRASGYVMLFADLLPTIIHVYVFTACFILYGALKNRSRSGMASLAVFALCTLLIFAVTPEPDGAADLSPYIRTSYMSFSGLNFDLMNLLTMEKTSTQTPELSRILFTSSAGIVVMRLIAFSYTYHYLNWFSKTSIIKWHKVPQRALAVIVGLWLFSLALYAYDFAIALHVLFLISLLHVLLEFPLNQRTFVGIVHELRGLALGRK